MKLQYVANLVLHQSPAACDPAAAVAAAAAAEVAERGGRDLLLLLVAGSKLAVAADLLSASQLFLLVPAFCLTSVFACFVLVTTKVLVQGKHQGKHKQTSRNLFSCFSCPFSALSCVTTRMASATMLVLSVFTSLRGSSALDNSAKLQYPPVCHVTQ